MEGRRRRDGASLMWYYAASRSSSYRWNLGGLSDLKLAGQTILESALSPRLIIDRIAATKRSFFGRSSPKAAI
jgi:hypothetical protein